MRRHWADLNFEFQKIKGDQRPCLWSGYEHVMSHWMSQRNCDLCWLILIATLDFFGIILLSYEPLMSHKRSVIWVGGNLAHFVLTDTQWANFAGSRHCAMSRLWVTKIRDMSRRKPCSFCTHGHAMSQFCRITALRYEPLMSHKRSVIWVGGNLAHFVLTDTQWANFAGSRHCAMSRLWVTQDPWYESEETLLILYSRTRNEPILPDHGIALWAAYESQKIRDMSRRKPCSFCTHGHAMSQFCRITALRYEPRMRHTRSVIWVGGNLAHFVLTDTQWANFAGSRHCAMSRWLVTQDPWYESDETLLILYSRIRNEPILPDHGIALWAAYES